MSRREGRKMKGMGVGWGGGYGQEAEEEGEDLVHVSQGNGCPSQCSMIQQSVAFLSHHPKTHLPPLACSISVYPSQCSEIPESIGLPTAPPTQHTHLHPLPHNVVRSQSQ